MSAAPFNDKERERSGTLKKWECFFGIWHFTLVKNGNLFLRLSKGQFISKGLIGVFVSTK